MLVVGGTVGGSKLHDRLIGTQAVGSRWNGVRGSALRLRPPRLKTENRTPTEAKGGCAGSLM